jgi:hypothetical protein
LTFGRHDGRLTIPFWVRVPKKGHGMPKKLNGTAGPITAASARTLVKATVHGAYGQVSTKSAASSTPSRR